MAEGGGPRAGRAAPGRLTISIAAPDGQRRAARGLGPWLARVAPARARGEATIALVSDGRMRSLNRTFLGRDYATDVLSFPAVDAAPRGGARYLGDIVIATGVAARQADEAGHALSTELRVLALHGLLHLLGHDHERDGGAMARLEARLRRKGGLTAGLIERGRR
ncbi:MAG: rRNA maturation RNase YbeY [Acidobacteriota bacterium]